jgi:hypothetical protein
MTLFFYFNCISNITIYLPGEVAALLFPITKPLAVMNAFNLKNIEKLI